VSKGYRYVISFTSRMMNLTGCIAKRKLINTHEKNLSLMRALCKSAQLQMSPEWLYQPDIDIHVDKVAKNS